MAAQYRPALVAAETDLQAARAAVAEWLISQQAAIADVAQYARTVTPGLSQCKSMAEELHTLLDDPRIGINARVRAKEESDKLVAEAIQLEQLALAAEKALAARALLSSAEEKKFIEPVQAVRLLREAEEVTRGQPSSIQCIADAADAARVATRAVQNALKSALLDQFPASPMNFAFQCTASTHAKVAHMLEALRSISDGLWSASLNDIATRLRTSILAPLPQATNVALTFSDKNGGAKLSGTNVSISAVSPAFPLDNAVAVLKFVRTVFSECRDAAKHVANALWPELQLYVQEKYILDTLPTVYTDLAQYDAPQRVGELEQLAASLGIEPARSGALTAVAKDVDGNFVKAVAQRAFGSLRAALLDERWDAENVGSYDSATLTPNDLFETSPYQFPRCSVSTKSKACITAIKTLLSTAITASPTAAAALWLSARDAAILYVAVVPYAHKTKLATRLTCIDLSHEILFVPYSYKSSQTPALSFADISETIRELAGEHFTQLLQQHQREALELLSEAEGFAYTHHPGPRSRAENAIKRVVHFCQQHTTLSTGVLPSHLHRSVAEAITNTVFAETVNAVLRLTDIDQNAHLSDLLLQLLPLATDSEKTIPTLDRFQKVITLLDARLVDIPSMYESGSLSAITSLELQALVRALFSDSPLRQSSLQRINSAKPPTK